MVADVFVEEKGKGVKHKIDARSRMIKLNAKHAHARTLSYDDDHDRNKIIKALPVSRCHRGIEKYISGLPSIALLG